MFESLIDARTDHRRHFWTPVTIMIAIAVHGCVLAGIVIADYLRIPPINPPAISVTFASFTPPPPPAAPPPAPPKPAPTPTPKPVQTPPPMPTEMVAPSVIPKEISTVPPPEPPPAPAGFGVPGGVPGGEPGGVPGGVPMETGPLRVGGDVSAPVLISQTPPIYPMAARSVRLQGTVILEAVIRKDGTVGDIRVVKGLGMGCTEAAVEALKSWRFRPGERSGVPVDVYYTLTVGFKLS